MYRPGLCMARESFAETPAMTHRAIAPTGIESPFGEEELLVSKTDLRGRITYANDAFLRVSHFAAKDVIGSPHNVIRHPYMPRCVFKLVWDTILAGREIFAYILNIAKNGDHYWVFAHVTPTFGEERRILGFHSNRRKPHRDQVAQIESLYERLYAEESRFKSGNEGMKHSAAILAEACKERGLDYDEFVLTL